MIKATEIKFYCQVQRSEAECKTRHNAKVRSPAKVKKWKQAREHDQTRAWWLLRMSWS
jgi:hypothetical protein